MAWSWRIHPHKPPQEVGYNHQQDYLGDVEEHPDVSINMVTW
jgi:hypothetical protein